MTQEIDQIADDELLARLQRLARTDHALTARLLVHMGEVDARGLGFMPLGWVDGFR